MAATFDAPASLYDRDFYAWTQEQAGLLREGRWSALDVEHLAEEIESMGRSERRELISRLTALSAHLLKMTTILQASVIEHRRDTRR